MGENAAMPLPSSPTQKPQSSKAVKAHDKSNQDLLLKSAVLVLIGLGLLLSPRFMAAGGLHDILLQSQPVGWLALLLGVAMLGLYGWRRVQGPTRR